MKNPLVRLGFQGLLAFERLIARYSPHGNATFIDAAEFPWAGEIEKEWRLIRAELDEVLRNPDAIPAFQQISEDQKALTQDNNWKTFIFYGYGLRSEKNCARCPQTDRLLQKIPGMKTAFFSILAPGKHLPAHRGPFKGVLRYHLGLLIPHPPESCRIRVGRDIRSWQEGKTLIFDDTHDHEAWNDSPDQQRVVLFVDFIRPLPAPLSWLNRFLIFLIGISPFVQDAKKNQLNWDAKLEELMNQATKGQ